MLEWLNNGPNRNIAIRKSTGTKNNFFSSAPKYNLMLAQTPKWWETATSLWLKRLEIETDHTPPLSAEVISVWSSTFSLSRLHGIASNLGLGWRSYCCILSLSQRCRQIFQCFGLWYRRRKRRLLFIYQLTPFDIQKDLNCQRCYIFVVVYVYFCWYVFNIPLTNTTFLQMPLFWAWQQLSLQSSTFLLICLVTQSKQRYNEVPFITKTT